MAAGLQCDNCRKFGPSHAPDWLYLIRQPGTDPILTALFGPPSEPLTFCTILCVAQYAYVKAMTTEAPAGVEPQQGPEPEPPSPSGIGWPG